MKAQMKARMKAPMNTMSNHELKALRDLRNRIDRIDLKILNLINQRLETGKKIGRIKNETGAHIIDDIREYDLIERLSGLNKGPADDQLVKDVFDALIKANRGIQETDLRD